MTITKTTIAKGLKTAGGKAGTALVQGCSMAAAMVLANYALLVITEKHEERKQRKQTGQTNARKNRMDEMRAELARMEKEATAS